jgi:hypothetical protein
MPLVSQLKLKRCPHCQVADPNLACVYDFVTENSEGQAHREWGCYVCKTCGGVVIAWAPASPLLGEPRTGIFLAQKVLMNPSLTEQENTSSKQFRVFTRRPALLCSLPLRWMRC